MNIQDTALFVLELISNEIIFTLKEVQQLQVYPGWKGSTGRSVIIITEQLLWQKSIFPTKHCY